MRLAFVDEVTKIAQNDPDAMLLTGDLGYSVFEDFQKKMPEQFLNVGVAEQNLIGVAAGLALAGKKVFVYSISTFATMRPYEQIRVDVCYQNLPIFIIGGGSSFSYSTFGCTHMPLEDLGAMRLLPNMAVMCPGDAHEVRALVRDTYKRGGPAYIRIAKRGEPLVHESIDLISLGQASVVREGQDAAILVCGRQLPFACAASDRLKEMGIHCGVISMPTLKPLDEDAIRRAAKTKVILTVEEHFLKGGLFTAVAEFLILNYIKTPCIPLAIPDEFPKGVGSQEYFLERYGITTDNMVKQILEALEKKYE